MNNSKLVVFDFDGTIADTFPHSAASYNRHAASFGLPQVEPADYDTVRALGMSGFFKQLKISPLDLIRFIQIVQNDIRNSMDEIQPFAGLPEVLRDMAQTHTLAIVTSNQDDIVAAFLERHGLAELFSEVRCEKNLFGKGKVIKKVIKKLGRPEDAVYVGDEVRDVTAATEAGVRAIAVTWGFDLEPVLVAAQPLVSVHTPQELAAAVTQHLG